MSQTATAIKRGGNRLTPDHPCWHETPTYTRRRCFGPDPERRDRHQRTRTQRAVVLALSRGELSATLAAVMVALLDRCSDTLIASGSEDERASGWWSLGFIARLVLGGDRYPDKKSGGERTGERWMSALVKLGWVESVHRTIVVNGKKRATSNLWRLRIPDHLRDELVVAEDAARAAKVKHRSRVSPKQHAGPVLDGRQMAAARKAVSNARRSAAPCPSCAGDGWVSAGQPVSAASQMAEVTRCATCEGSGTSP